LSSFGGRGDDNRGGCNSASRGRGNETNLGNAKNLANVDVGAISVDLGVVEAEDGAVHAEGLNNLLAGVIGLNFISLLAVFALGSEADFLTDLQVAAFSVHTGEVDSGELVGRSVVCSGDLVAVILLLNGVGTSTVSGRGNLSDEREGSNSNDEKT